MPRFYVPNPGFEREIGKEVSPQLAAAAEQARSAAEARAVRIMPRNTTSFEVQTDDEVALVNTDYGGHIAEFGSKNSPPYAPLRTGVRAAGFRLDES